MQLSKFISRSVATIALAAAAASCDEASAREETSRTASAGTVETRAQGVATFELPEIANIAIALNQAGADQASIALERASSRKVRLFAQHMLDEHARAAERLERLRSRVGRTKDETSPLLQRAARLATEDLQTREGAAFDLAYVTEQVVAYSTLVGLLDVSLLPSAEQAPAADQTGAADEAVAETVNELRSLRSSVVHHDVQALELQKALRYAAAGGPKLH